MGLSPVEFDKADNPVVLLNSVQFCIKNKNKGRIEIKLAVAI